MFRGNRQFRRMFDKMGLNMNQLDDVEEVIIKTASKDIIIKKPTVAEIQAQDSTIYQVVAEDIEEIEKKVKKFNEEDVMLVAQQAGVSKEEAEKALEEAEGDLARAILMLTT
ncbi:MAG: nascent polypeptide-associated complex protein [Candidatus Nitrosocaldaceae archaeon]|nr:MAG: nascent polypeptide-associated complex protein [Candidatus Nitrosocaldaceae archaeon]